MLNSTNMKRRKSKKPDGVEGYIASLREVAFKSQKKADWIKYQRSLQQLEMPLELDTPFQALHNAFDEAATCAELRDALAALQKEYKARGLRSRYPEKLYTVHEADSGHHSCPSDSEGWNLVTFHSDAPTCRRCGTCDCDKCEHDRHYWDCRNCWRDTHDERCDDLRNGDPCTHDFEEGEGECGGLRCGLVSEETEDTLCEACGIDEGIRIISCDC